MSMKGFVGFAALAIVIASLMGCGGGAMYGHQKPLPDGSTATYAGRTNAFGVDTGIVQITQPPAKAAEPIFIWPELVKTSWSYERYERSWDGCADKEPNKRARNIKRRDIRDGGTQQHVVYPNVIQRNIQTPVVTSAGGATPSTGNVLVPTLAGTAGYVIGQGVRRPPVSNINVAGGAGGKGGEASSASSSASASESGAEVGVNVGQWTDIGINID